MRYRYVLKYLATSSVGFGAGYYSATGEWRYAAVFLFVVLCDVIYEAL